MSPEAYIFQQALSSIDAGQVLDVATGSGGFIGVLEHSLRSYQNIIGVDIEFDHLFSAHASFSHNEISFIQTDAEKLPFAANWFDLVCLAASLHHLNAPKRVLAAMYRALKPNGYFLVCDYHQDATSEPQHTAVQIHHFAATVDAAQGIPHHPTYLRQEIIRLLEATGVRDLAIHDTPHPEEDPFDVQYFRGVEAYLQARIERAIDLSEHKNLINRGETLYQRLQTVGVQREPLILIIGRKPLS